MLPFYANAKGLASSFAHSGCAGRTSHVSVQELLLHAILPASASRASMLLCHLSCRLTVPHVPDTAALASVFATHARLVLTSLVYVSPGHRCRGSYKHISRHTASSNASHAVGSDFFFFPLTKSGAQSECKLASKALFPLEKLPSYGRLRTASKSIHGRYELLATFHAEIAHNSMALRSSCTTSLCSVCCDTFQFGQRIVHLLVQAEEPYPSSCNIPPSKASSCGRLAFQIRIKVLLGLTVKGAMKTGYGFVSLTR